MKVIERAGDCRSALEAERAAGRTVGLVPTMGALHDGHLSLVRRALGAGDTVCLSIFVNPLQFGPGEDLDSYPRDLEADLRAAERSGVSIVFVPPVEEMVPPGARTRVRVDGLGDVLEGASRPGHFEGVATVVTKLVSVAGSCRAYFGEKDFQQLVVVRRLVDDLSLPVEVVACPTVRALDGLALSSRNRRLSGEDREAASVLVRALQAGVASIVAGERDPGEVRRLVGDIVEAEPVVELDYAEVVAAASLEVPEKLDGELRLLVAARVGALRLIDNLGVRL